MAKVKPILILLGTFGLILVAAYLLTTVGKTFGQYFFGKDFAENQLKEYVASVLKQEVNGVSCQSMDTDGNGYVSCDFTTTAEPNRERTIECAGWGLDGFFNRGCKARPILPSR